MIASVLTAAPKSRPDLRHAADHAGLGRERHVVQDLLLVGDRRHAFGHADAEVHDAAHRQLERAAARDDLALVERHRRQHVERHLELAGEGGVVDGAVGLVVVLGLRDHDAVDQHAGHHAPGAD